MAQEFKDIVRLGNADIMGNLPLYRGLCKIHGVGHMLSNAICNSLDLSKTKKTGDLSDQELNLIEELLKNPQKLPSWLLNRRRDMETGRDLHLVGPDLKFRKDMDIKMMKKLKTYRGMRHSLGQPVRGQRTRSHFRKGKSVGVSKKTKAGKKG